MKFKFSVGKSKINQIFLSSPIDINVIFQILRYGKDLRSTENIKVSLFFFKNVLIA
jgi:hypothetical protein